MTQQITLTIDGVEVRTQPGKTILQVAMDAGIYIPYLCYYPGMKPYGACRMCVVELENQKGTPASCTTPVAQGMAVKTNSSQIVGLRRGIMELLISEHPHGCLTCHRIELCGPQDICLRHVKVNDRCVICPKNERCELKDTVRHLEMDLTTPLTYNNRHLPLETKDPFWDRDLNLCIVCGRCVRVCEEVRGDNALTFSQRAGKVLIGTSKGTSVLESGCEFCGACIDVCPTGALVERDYKWDKAVETVTTVCPHCPVGCQVKLEVNKRNKVIRSIGELSGPANMGQLCFKGKFGMDFVNHKKRLRRPLVRRNGSLEEASWDEALNLIATRLQEHRGDGFALIASPRMTNEDIYVAQKFARAVMGTNNVDLSSNLRPELAATLGDVLGYQAGTNSIWELEGSRCIMVVLSNVTEEHNVVGVPVKRAAKNGANLLVIDPRETELTRHASLWLRARPGTEVILIGGILWAIMNQALENSQFVAQHTHGLDALKNSLGPFDLPKVEEVTGVPQDRIKEAAKLFAAGPSAILYALDTVPTERRQAFVKALVNLALLTGNLGKPSTGLFPLIPGANEQGAKDVGCSPHLLPGYHRVDDAEARARFQAAWGVALPSTPGIGIGEIVNGIRDGHIQALQIVGDSPNFTNGELANFLDSLKGLKLLLVQDTFRTELAELAHVVLPASTFAEKDGTYTNIERRVQLLKPALRSVGEEKPDWWIFAQLALRMGARGFAYESSFEIMEEIASLSPIYAGVSHRRLESGSLQWPVSNPDHPGTPILYTQGFNGRKASFSPMELEEAPKPTSQDFPLILVRGRLLHQPEHDLAIVNGNGRNLVKRDEIIEIHSEDAHQLGINDGDWVEVTWPGHSIKGRARLSSPHKGLVSTTLLFGELATRLEASPDPDPMLKVPGLPLVPARVAKAL